MNRKLILFLSLAVPLALSACGKRLTMNDALQQGGKQLSGPDVVALVTDKTLHVAKWDNSIEADVILAGSGKLSGKNSVGQKTGGRWKVTNDNTLCLSYDDWGQKDMRCFVVFEKEGGFSMFLTDGSLDSTFTVTGISASDLSFSGVGMGRSMPGSEGLNKTETTTDKGNPRTLVIPDEEKKNDSWWKLGLFSNTKDADAEASGDFAAPAPPPPSREKSHLLDDKECAHCDLTGENLRDAELKKADLEGANLSNADLSGAVLRGANLKNATLGGAKLATADLSDADLTGADLTGANLEGAKLQSASLAGAVLVNARMVDAVLEDAVLTNANLEEANLHWADLTKADLKGANLKKSYLIKANFTKADLTGADLSEAMTQRGIFDSAIGYAPPAVDKPESESKPAEEEKEKKSFFNIF
ncbi:MAG: pentapeptide repeat-containing protein [Pseudomonadota bacterium]